MTEERPASRLHRPSTSMLAWAILAALGLIATACGDNSASPGVAVIGKAASTTTTIPAAASNGPLGNLQQNYQDVLAYAACMRSHGDPSFPTPQLVDNSHRRGITMPSVNTKTPQYASADKDCRHLLPNGGNGPTQAQRQAAVARALKFAKCMRSHGVPSFPDPTVSSSGKGFSIRIGGPGLDVHSPQLRAAQNHCRSLLPGGGP